MWNKKEHNFIITWVINSHMGPKYRVRQNDLTNLI